MTAMGNFRVPAAQPPEFRRLGGTCSACSVQPRRGWPADIDGDALVRAAFAPDLRRCAVSGEADLIQLGRIASTLCLARAFPDRGHARPAGGDQRRSRRARSGRRLSDPFDDPLGQGTGVAQRSCILNVGRRLHPVGLEHRIGERDRGGTATAVRGDDPRQGRVLRLMVPQRFYSASTDRSMATGMSMRRAAVLSERADASFRFAAWPPPEGDAKTNLSSLTPDAQIDIASPCPVALAAAWLRARIARLREPAAHRVLRIMYIM